MSPEAWLTYHFGSREPAPRPGDVVQVGDLVKVSVFAEDGLFVYSGEVIAVDPERRMMTLWNPAEVVRRRTVPTVGVIIEAVAIITAEPDLWDRRTRRAA